LHPSLAAVAITLVLVTACAQDSPTSPAQDLAAMNASPAGGPIANVTTMPSGERTFGKVAVEPAYDADTGEIMYLLTPIKAPLPSHANVHARSPLYIVEYPASSTVSVPLNCAGVPGNCPDHDLDLAAAATSIMPGVYGTDPTVVLGHDHVGDNVGAPDFNVAWEVVEVLFTNSAAANMHLTTDQQIADAVAAGDAIEVDLGFAFNCSVVPAVTYWKGTPVG